MFSSAMKHVVVVGAGLAGLAFSRTIRLAGVHVTLLESSSRTGGWLRSEEVHDRDPAEPGCRSFLFERACRGFRPRGSGLRVARLVEELGLADEALVTGELADKRFVLLNGKLEAVPSSPLEMLRSPLWPTMAADLLAELWKVDATGDLSADESIRSLFSRRFSEALADNMIDPMMSGIYAGNTSELSARSVLPEVFRLHRQHGSILRGAVTERLLPLMAPLGLGGPMPPAAATTLTVSPHQASLPAPARQRTSPFVRGVAKASSMSFVDGVETVPRRLTAVLEEDDGVDLRLNAPVAAVEARHGGPERLQVRLADGEVLPADAVAMCGGAHQSAQLVAPAGASSGLQQAAAALRGIPRASVGLVNFGFAEEVVPEEARGFGYLVPSGEGEKVLGCVFDHLAFPGQDRRGSEGCSRLTVIMGGARHRDVADWSPEQLVEEAQSSIARHAGIRAEFAVAQPRIALDAIPQYTVGHEERVRCAEKAVVDYLPGTWLLGNSFRGIGAADTVAGAEAAARAAAVDLGLASEAEMLLIDA